MLATPLQALTKQVTDTVSLQAEIEAQQATINSLQQDVAQLEQLNGSKDTMLEDLQAGNARLREKLELAEALRKQADKASEVSGGVFVRFVTVSTVGGRSATKQGLPARHG